MEITNKIRNTYRVLHVLQTCENEEMIIGTIQCLHLDGVFLVVKKTHKKILLSIIFSQQKYSLYETRTVCNITERMRSMTVRREPLRYNDLSK